MIARINLPMIIDVFFTLILVVWELEFTSKIFFFSKSSFLRPQDSGKNGQKRRRSLLEP